MKKFYLSALGCLLAMGVNAQAFEQVGSVSFPETEFGLSLSIPTSFAFEGKSTPFSLGSEMGENLQFSVYNKSFGVDRIINVDYPTSYRRTEVETREAVLTSTEVGRKEWNDRYVKEYDYMYASVTSYRYWWVMNKCNNTTYTDEYVSEWFEYKSTNDDEFHDLNITEKKEYDGGTLFILNRADEFGFYDEETDNWVIAIYAFYFKEDKLYLGRYVPDLNLINDMDDYYTEQYSDFYNMQIAEFTQEYIEEYINLGQGLAFQDYDYTFNGYRVSSIDVESDGNITFHTNAREEDYYEEGYSTLKFVWNTETNALTAIGVKYVNCYIGEWTKTVEESEYDHESMLYDMIAYPWAIGQTGELDDAYILATQTLFNNDAKWEFIRPVYKEKIDEYYTRDRDGDGEIDYKETEYWNQTVGYEIVSEDGNVLATIDVEENGDCYPMIIKWDDDVFFGVAIEIETKGEYDDYIYETHMVIYGIDKNTTNISRVAATAPSMRVTPTLANRNSTVNVALSEDMTKNGGELIITDSNGRTIGRRRVEIGQKNIPVTTDRMASGVYNITLTEQGQRVENARIIVK